MENLLNEIRRITNRFYYKEYSTGICFIVFTEKVHIWIDDKKNIDITGETRSTQRLEQVKNLLIENIDIIFQFIEDNSESNAILEKMNQRQRQILVHSFLYYELGTTTIPDSRFNNFAQELKILQNQYPKIASKTVYAEDFEGFEGSTGYDLDYRKPEIMSKAYKLLDYIDKTKN